MQTRTPRAFVAAAALALFAGACTDAPTAPARRPGAAMPALTASDGQPVLIPNSVKYRDTGGRPATGRSGSAELEALALLSKDGATTLEVQARHVDPAIQNTGTVGKLQLKALAPDGTTKFVRNFHGQMGTEPMVLRGLTRGDALQFQANVRGLDGNRTDIVTVTETVKRLPDLRVEISAPEEVAANMPMNVLAVVSEQNGDLGTIADCRLYAGGQLVDHANGLWVDAGDAVTCALTWTPAIAGSYPLEVRVSTGDSPEWDDSDNLATATLRVRDATPEFSTNAYFRQLTSVDSGHYEDRWRWGLDGVAGESVSDVYDASTDQRGGMYGHMRGVITEPVVVRVSMSTGGRVVHEAEWTDAHPYSTDDWCTGQWEAGAGFFMCSRGWLRQTSFDYAFMAGAVTYHSQGFMRTWDELTGADTYVYHWNQNEEWDETVTLGGDWTFDVRLTTPSAEHAMFKALRLVRAEPWGYGQPYECSTWEEPYWEYSQTSCASWIRRFESIDGV
jgi:hypothetical protein